MLLPHMHLHGQWRNLLKRAWCLRFMALAGVLTGAEAILPVVGYKLPLNDVALAVLTFVVVALAFWSRLVAQRGI